MADELTNDIPIGDIRLYDNYLPALDAGNWFIQVNHTLTDKDGKPVNMQDGMPVPLSSLQEFVVSAPQFALDPTEVISKYPPDGSTGRYGEVLPNIVLGEPLLPWERKITDASSTAREPWLALLVFGEDELIGGDENSPTHLINTNVENFLKPDDAGKLLKPLKPTDKEADVKDADPCAYIQISTSLFQALAPRLHELRYLAHCRQVNTGDKAIAGLNEHGLFSVVVANRFPLTPAPGQPGATKNIVHLVSLEHMEAYLVNSPNFGAFERVALLSLASWTFQALADNKEDFKGLMTNMLYQPDGQTPFPPEHLWLRLPFTSQGGAGAAQAEAGKRLKDGFVPLAYHTRTGEDTFAWFRGPLTPLLTRELKKPSPFPTADSAIIYQSAFGVFDFSLAGAWNIGRSVALSDKAFGRMLLDFRRGAHALTDKLLHRLQSDSFTQNQIDELDHDTTVQDEFLRILNTQLLADIGSSPALNPDLTPPQSNPADTNPQTAVKNFMADPAVQAKILNLVKTDLDPVSQWLARLLLLHPLPFNYLVPDERMLPVESLRFFYMDNTWLGAMLDGALSIGMESSRETFFFEMTHDMIHGAAHEAAKVLRGSLSGAEPPAGEASANLMSGLLIRSAVISGWPNLAVRPYLKGGGGLLKILRMDHLSPNVLLCIFWGVPDFVEISEPQEGFAFGVDEDGSIPLRNPRPPGATPLGEQLPGDPLFKIRDLTQQQKLFMRSATSRVLDLDPGSPGGLIQSLKSALETQLRSTLGSFNPADFALQMVKSPEAVKLDSQSS